VQAYVAYGVCGSPADGQILEGFVKLGGSAVWERSWCGSFLNDRGVSILKIDPFTCTLLESRRFDTWFFASSATDLTNYLDGLSDGDVVVGVTGDEPRSLLGPALPTLLAWGVDVADVGIRGSFAFVAQKGDASKTVMDKVPSNFISAFAPAEVDVIVQGSLRTFTHYSRLHTA